MKTLEEICDVNSTTVLSVELAHRVQRGYRLLRQRVEARSGQHDRRRHWGANDIVDIGLARADSTDNLHSLKPGDPLSLADGIEQAMKCGCIPAIHRGVAGVC